MVARQRELEFFMAYWEAERKKDLVEVFKTPEC